MILATFRILPSPTTRRETFEILESIQGPTRARPGCAGCDILEEAGSDRAILYYERWESEEALREHIRSEHYRRILAAIDLASQPPEIRFYLVSGAEGIELIERLRNGDRDAPQAKQIRLKDADENSVPQTKESQVTP